ncbi:MAG: NifB/NifX family molybdenum-iron cluster-binding protein [Candidatus Thorarchaeota archaeon]
MKICITAQGPTLDAPVDSRFGRCANFIFVDPDSMQFSTIPNPGAMASGGAGIQAAQLIIDQGASTVLTGQVGPNAYNALSAGNVAMFIGVLGTVRNALAQFKAGQLTEVTFPTTPAHAGMGRGGGRGGGRGRGRGQG